MLHACLPRNSSPYLSGGGTIGLCCSTTGMVLVIRWSFCCDLFIQPDPISGKWLVLAGQGLALRVEVLGTRLDESDGSPAWSDGASSPG